MAEDLFDLQAESVPGRIYKKTPYDEKRYFNVEAEVNSELLEFALKRLPERLKKHLLDGLDHIRKGFFKALYYSTALKNPRFIFLEKDKIWLGNLKVYRNPNKGSILDMELGIFTRSDILAIHEFGGTISARNSKMLTIPFRDRRFKRGFRFRRDEEGYKKDKLFVISSKGRLLLAGKANGRLVPYFLLVQSVTLKPRLKFFATWNRMEGFRARAIDEKIEKAINEA